MISKAKIKFIRSLEQKKFRKSEGVFVAEGPKTVTDIAACESPLLLVATEEWLKSCPDALGAKEVIQVTDDGLRKVSFLQHPQQVLAVFPQFEPASEALSPTDLALALDGVQDPGNLGTIIRIADWFGITRIICDTTTADCYNPKVIQATMGSIARVRLTYTGLAGWIAALPKGTPVYGTLLDGENMYARPIEPHGVIVMGNEGNGISDRVAALVSQRLLIPCYPPERDTADSLNVATATAIVCAEFRRLSAAK